MTSTHHKSKEKRAIQSWQEANAAKQRRCPECQHTAAMVQITSRQRCRFCGATFLTEPQSVQRNGGFVDRLRSRFGRSRVRLAV